jgi:hypothetical protein
VNIFGENTAEGRPYKKDYKNFYQVDKALDFYGLPGGLGTIISHGLFHFPHGRMTKQVQKMSILASCNILKTDKFLPPFNEWDEHTVDICKKADITIIGDSEYNNKVRRYLKKEELPKTEEKWKSFETEKFDPSFNHWLFHSWRFTPESFEKKLLEDMDKISK